MRVSILKVCTSYWNWGLWKMCRFWHLILLRGINQSVLYTWHCSSASTWWVLGGPLLSWEIHPTSRVDIITLEFSGVLADLLFSNSNVVTSSLMYTASLIAISSGMLRHGPIIVLSLADYITSHFFLRVFFSSVNPIVALWIIAWRMEGSLRSSFVNSKWFDRCTSPYTWIIIITNCMY